jgi:predicted DNA-binding protein
MAKDKQFNIRVSEVLRDRLQAVASRKGLDVSEIARAALDAWLAENEEAVNVKKHVDQFFNDLTAHRDSVKPAFKDAFMELYREMENLYPNMPGNWIRRNAARKLHGAIWDSGRLGHAASVVLNEVFFRGEY